MVLKRKPLRRQLEELENFVIDLMGADDETKLRIQMRFTGVRTSLDFLSTSITGIGRRASSDAEKLLEEEVG